MNAQTNQHSRIQSTQLDQNESRNSDNTDELMLRIRVLEEKNRKQEEESKKDKLLIAKLITKDIPAAHRSAESGVASMSSIDDDIDQQANADYLNTLLAKSYVGLGALVEWICFLKENAMNGRPLDETV